jgi:hypothetical protein
MREGRKPTSTVEQGSGVARVLKKERVIPDMLTKAEVVSAGLSAGAMQYEKQEDSHLAS